MRFQNRTGFEQTSQGLFINKDPQAQLTYTFDWSEWLEDGDSIAGSTYTVAARVNDPIPVVIESQGNTSTVTFVELSGGQADKAYVVTCRVETTNGFTDRRNFTVEVINRSG